MRLARLVGTLALVPALASAQARGLGFDPANLDRAVRPQDDFFAFANGGWAGRTTIPGDRSSVGTFVELADRSETRLRAILEGAAADRAAPSGSNRRKLGDLYASWMDSVAIERAGRKAVQPLLDRIAKLRGHRELPALYGELARHAIGRPFSTFVGQDDRDATRYVVNVGQSGLGMGSRDAYLRDGERFEKLRTAYVTYLTTLLRLMGEADPAAGAAELFALEKALAEKHWEPARNRDPVATYNARSVAQLDSLTPGFSWGRYLDAAGVRRTPIVVVAQVDVLQAQHALVMATPIPVLRRWFTVKVLDAMAPHLSHEYVDAQFAFRGTALRGQQVNRDRWKRGVQWAEGAMGEALGEQFVAQTFTPADRARMLGLVQNLLATFDDGIGQLAWMGPETRKAAKAKLAKFTVKIGYPDKWEDYSALKVVRGDHAGNMLRSRVADWQRNARKLGGPVDRLEWGMTPQTINAYYNPSMNEIVFPAAILQPTFFDPAADDATNYGAIGGVIGHEISHGFDDQGSQYDGDGNLRNWWTDDDRKAFEARTSKLVAQYDALEAAGQKVNGKLTLGENIGDLSGLTVAYRAWQRSLGGRAPEVIDGFTGPQRFFMGWAQGWRQVARDEAVRQQVLTDPHAPNQYRVNQVLRNMPEFAEAFGVKEGDRMWLAPAERVAIW
ncbi:MAG: M13 family metallopeptidase [Gemmatimonadales bacterium]|nr:M13 family metallopeptidase [Gemmatimonadales bacterium]